MPSEQIQWFPGHMAKTRRLITENLKNVDIVIEILDARIPYSSQNPEIRRLCAAKPSIILLNKASLADPSVTKAFSEHYSNELTVCIETDCISGYGISKIAPAIRKLCGEKLARYEEKGMMGRRVRAMVLGVPNVGKSSLINRICGNKKAKVENRPGVTRGKQWVTVDPSLLLLDTPGILWPKFEDEFVGRNLAFTGAIRDEVYDIAEVACELCTLLAQKAPEALCEKYKLTSVEGLMGHEILFDIGKKRGCLISGGDVDYDRAARILLDEFRACKLGKIVLETPKDVENNDE